jgi:malate synthase
MELLSQECIEFLNLLDYRFEESRQELLKLRIFSQYTFDNNPNSVKERNWICDPVPRELNIEGVEITGKKALSCGAQVYMADFEDSLSPTWSNIIEGHKNIVEISGLERKTLLFVRPRGLHLNEAHMFNMSASLFDFGVNFFHTAKFKKPYYYLPKLEHSREAKWWADVFAYAEEAVGIRQKTIKCNILIETFPAVFQMDEILYELSDYATGLNAGRWDYIFSFIKHNRTTPLSERNDLHMRTTFMNAYSNLLAETCHRRGVVPIGGMSAYVPVKNDEEGNASALKQVEEDKIQEGIQGFRRTWVAHPGLVELAQDSLAKGKNQRVRRTIGPETEKLINSISESAYVSRRGIRNNIAVAMEYIAAWLNGVGCVAINNLMEDAATAEIARTQLWQWRQHNILRESDYLRIASEEKERLLGLTGAYTKETVELAYDFLKDLVLDSYCQEFLTIEAYKSLTGFDNDK